MVTRLSTGDWFTAKVSACGLFTAAYKHISEPDQRTLLRAQVALLDFVAVQLSLGLVGCFVYTADELIGCRPTTQSKSV